MTNSETVKEEKKLKKTKEPQKIINLKEQLFLCKKIHSNINAFLFILDLNTNKFVWISDYHRKLLGYKVDLKKQDSKALLNLFHPDDRDLLKEMKEFFSKTKKGVFSSIYRLKKGSGDFFWVYTNVKIFKKTHDLSTFQIVGLTVDFSLSINYNKHVKQVLKEKLQESNTLLIANVSGRELEIMRYFANGYKTKEIAEELDISFHTVNNHRKNILKKLKLRNLASMVNFAVENGLD